jgi:hypothetical protein
VILNRIKMSKWNVKTTDGRVLNASAKTLNSALTNPPPPQVADTGFANLESGNPMFGGSNGKKVDIDQVALLANYTDKQNSCLHKCGTTLESRNGKICLGLCVLLVLIIVTIVAVLFPRFPGIDIDRNETADSITVSLCC